MNKALLNLRDVGHAYGLKTVLEDIDLTLEAGQVLALVGPSGCGLDNGAAEQADHGADPGQRSTGVEM